MATEQKRMRQLAASEAEWTSANTVLLDGEIAFSTDVQKYKVGDGVSTWSSLPYWDPTVSAPEDGQNYGLKGPNFWPTINYEEGYGGDLNNITPDKVKMVQVISGTTNGWDKITRGDVVMDIHNEIDGTRIQIGFNHSSEFSAGTVLHSRVLRGTWSDWVTHIAHGEVPFNGDLNDLAEGTADYFITTGTTSGVANAWPDIVPNSLVATMNVTGNIALQIGFERKTDTNEQGLLWMRRKESGVWQSWSRLTVMEADIFDLDRVRWRKDWVNGQTYEKNDMVLDGDWTMIANTQTMDRAAPQRDFNEVWDMPDVPVWTLKQHTGVVESGRRWTNTEPVTVVGYQVWVPTLSPDTNYVIRTFAYPEGRPEEIMYQEISEPLLIEDAWTTITVGQTLFVAGSVFGVVLNALNSGSETSIAGGWNRAANNNTLTVDPGTGAWGTNNAQTSLRINFTDLDTTDRKTEIMGIIIGSTFQAVQTDDTTKSITFTINAAPVDNTTHASFANVVVSDTGPNGAPDVGAACTLDIAVPVPSPTDYVEIVGGNPTHTWGTSVGLLELDGIAQPGADLNAYGVRVLVDTWTSSPDWDIVSSIGSGGGGGGDGGGASEFTQLTDTPDDYIGHAGKNLVVNGTEDGIDFVPGGGGGVTTFTGLTDTPVDYSGAGGYLVMVNSGGTALEFVAPGGTLPYVQKIGDTMTGALTLAGATQSQTRINWHNQSNAEQWIVDHLDTGGLRLVESGTALPYLFQADGEAGLDASVLRRSAGDARYLQPTQGDAAYLKLDASNGPVTGTLVVDKAASNVDHHVSFIDQADNVTGWYMNGQLYIVTKTLGTFKFDDNRELSASGSVVTRDAGDGRYGRLANFNTWSSGQTVEGNITAKGDYIRLNTSGLAKQVTLDFRTDAGFQQAIRMHDQGGYRNVLFVDGANLLSVGSTGHSFTGMQFLGKWYFTDVPTFQNTNDFLHTGNFRSVYKASGNDTAMVFAHAETIKLFDVQDAPLTGVSYLAGVFTIGPELDGLEANVQAWVTMATGGGTNRGHLELLIQWRVDNLGTWATVAGPFSNYGTRSTAIHPRGTSVTGVYRTTLADGNEFRIIYRADDEAGTSVFETGPAAMFDMEVIGA